MFGERTGFSFSAHPRWLDRGGWQRCDPVQACAGRLGSFIESERIGGEGVFSAGEKRARDLQTDCFAGWRVEAVRRKTPRASGLEAKPRGRDAAEFRVL